VLLGGGVRTSLADDEQLALSRATSLTPTRRQTRTRLGRRATSVASVSHAEHHRLDLAKVNLQAIVATLASHSSGAPQQPTLAPQPARVAFVERVCQVLLEHLPPLWKSGLSYYPKANSNKSKAAYGAANCCTGELLCLRSRPMRTARRRRSMFNPSAAEMQLASLDPASDSRRTQLEDYVNTAVSIFAEMVEKNFLQSADGEKFSDSRQWLPELVAGIRSAPLRPLPLVALAPATGILLLLAGVGWGGGGRRPVGGGTAFPWTDWARLCVCSGCYRMGAAAGLPSPALQRLESILSQTHLWTVSVLFFLCESGTSSGGGTKRWACVAGHAIACGRHFCAGAARGLEAQPRPRPHGSGEPTSNLLAFLPP
jgi:hypothetical protein